jgi:hypothetical protein
VKRGTAIVLTTALVAVAAVLLLVFALQLSSSNKGKTQIGDDTFQVGPAKTLVNQVPFLFQDLRNKDLDVWVNHVDGTWVTFLAHTPGERACAVKPKPKRKEFVDCHKKTYPPDGGELPHYATSVDSEGRLVVDFTG